MFLEAIKRHVGVWKLENMRAKPYFYWEEEDKDRYYSPSQALICAIMYGHRRYAQYLLSHYPRDALATPWMKASPLPRGAPHLALAVEYDRKEIMNMILGAAQHLGILSFYVNQKSGFGWEERTALHRATGMADADAVLMLLGKGADPNIEDSGGFTPLDIVLEQLGDSSVNMDAKRFCLHYLLLFSPAVPFRTKATLRGNEEYWGNLLGWDEYRYLIGKAPLPLSLCAMKTVLRCLVPSDFPHSVLALPIPPALKPVPAQLDTWEPKEP
ncbi:hypothetical protein XENTR_v10013178 [Xenopus tropicalis]|uniref:Ankyrin repeat domain-containing protein 9 n=1 Tax=Xenopus tropicalis TaxID=8364 RepID=A0A803J7C6_XENTR|nr:ankyrin repeat domain-containing protein 9 [Xenopus tropicalis]KAE8600307.1 hypothetical protein XENTR_v10013178 [Xenopus tropicalis]|eukprot:XP_012819442.1 PREDICTED: ankyrin repeat domain-containing protein 9-like [Xenopus tropicalis]